VIDSNNHGPGNRQLLGRDTMSSRKRCVYRKDNPIAEFIDLYTNSKLDLLAKVRYQNPLPAPPCPPKLLDIPTNPKRYTRPEFLDAATNEALLPMVVDAECGMPLDLGKWEALWEDGADDRGAHYSLVLIRPPPFLTPLPLAQH
jgi:hypothetical protein